MIKLNFIFIIWTLFYILSCEKNNNDKNWFNNNKKELNLLVELINQYQKQDSIFFKYSDGFSINSLGNSINNGIRNEKIEKVIKNIIG